MKHINKIIIASVITVGSFFTTQAQRFCYVDTEYILEKLPEYDGAQKSVDAFAKEWQTQIDQKYEKIERMYRDFQAEQVLLSEDMKRKREDEIINAEKAVKDFQKQKFGYEGELFIKRQELIKPIQDKVYDAIQTMATERSYNFVFDKSGTVTMLFTDPKYDKSDEILERIKEASK